MREVEQVIVEALDKYHWNGVGCGVAPDNPTACLFCYGPAPMTVWEIAQVVADALEEAWN